MVISSEKGGLMAIAVLWYKLLFSSMQNLEIINLVVT